MLSSDLKYHISYILILAGFRVTKSYVVHWAYNDRDDVSKKEEQPLCHLA